MSSEESRSDPKWFDNCGGYSPSHDLNELRRGIEGGRLNEQDEYGMTALHLSVSSGWLEGVEELLRTGADTELRHFRTGTTALYTATQSTNPTKDAMISVLVAAGANPDAPNYWGVTPRKWATGATLTRFDQIPHRTTALPSPHIQNAEHLADHYHPRFKIPERKERETMNVGQAVDLYVYGPKSETKQDTVKVRITARTDDPSGVRYKATVESPVETTHLTEGTIELEFGPENIASVYVTKPSRKTRKNRKTD